MIPCHLYFYVLNVLLLYSYSTSVTLNNEERTRCHRPQNRRSHRDCVAYITSITYSEYPSIHDKCSNITWQETNDVFGETQVLGTSGKWGSCVNITTKDDYRYVTTNNVPNFIFLRIAHSVLV